MGLTFTVEGGVAQLQVTARWGHYKRERSETVRDDKGQPTLAYVQASRNTFVELQPANANRPPGLNHFGLHVENLRATVATLKQRGVTVEEPRAGRQDSSVANATDPGGVRIELFEFGPESLQGKAISSYDEPRK